MTTVNPLLVPDTLAATCAPEMLGALEAVLAPPPELRMRGRVEVEVQAAGEGTFTITLEGGCMSAKKGFARDPLIAVAIPRGGFALLRSHLQAAVDGFAQAPELRRRWAALRAPRVGELDALVADLRRLTDAAVRLEVKGIGSYVLARGSVEEATRILTIAVEAAVVEGLLQGQSVAHARFAISGDKGVLTALAGAMAPALTRMSTAENVVR